MQPAIQNLKTYMHKSYPNIKIIKMSNIKISIVIVHSLFTAPLNSLNPQFLVKPLLLASFPESW